MTISTIALATTDVFGGGGNSSVSDSFSPKDNGTLKKWLNKPANPLKRLAGKTFESLPAIVGSIVRVSLRFLGKAGGFVAEHTWTLIVLVA